MNNGQKTSVGKVILKKNWVIWSLALVILFLSTTAMADICATVKIEIRQELTLERQAFDAHMRINNDLTHITLEDVNIEVLFTDENGDPVLASSDPNSTDALFFIRTDSMENIDDISGAGQVPPATSADIHWLIIPSPGSANANPQGTLYFVGARLTYSVGGEENVTEVTPDYIFVKPLPELTLDYFLPRDVFADDPFTNEIEPPEVFSLGARVQNNGHGIARNLKIESAQPEIVENELGLLIDFVIQGSQIGLAPAGNSLLINFGDIEPNTSKMAKWLMTTTLSGRFVDFDAEFTHSDELGGTLTSLIDAVNTHTLVKEVLVDVTGRDLVYDFLARDGDVYRVYESNGPDTPVVDHSGASILTFNSQSGGQRYYNLSTPVTAGFMVIRLPDPENSQRLLTSALRSDGKQIKPENIWLSKTQNEDHSWSRWMYLFDANTTGSYTLTYEDVSAVPQPPVIQLIADRTVTEGNQVSFIVEASDPNGTIPTLSAAPMPAGAQFTDSGDGTGIFDWTPQVGQTGTYSITYTASDGQLTASRQATITVCSIDDTDCDNLPDDWEIAHFGNLDRDGTGDADEDGITDFEEYQNGTDPNAAYTGPSVPGILSPADGAEVGSLHPTITISNSTGAGDIVYTFELYEDAAHTQLVVTDEDVAAGVTNTQWVVPVELENNFSYYWRVRASDGMFRSLWLDGRFIVNTANDPPSPFANSYPADNIQVDTVTPALEVVNTPDPDNDLVLYTFTVYTDTTLTQIVASSPDIAPGENGVTSWIIDTNLTDGESYSWQVTATDIHGATQWSGSTSFTVNLQNQAPTAPPIHAPSLDENITSPTVDLVVSNATDGDGDTLTYRFELDTAPTFDSPDLQVMAEVVEGTTTTSWPLTGLTDDTIYYWRVRATDGMAVSPWVTGTFFVNSQEDTPLTPVLRNPGIDAVVGTTTPVLRVYPGNDYENDHWVYRYEVYEREDLGPRVAIGEASEADWPIFPAVSDRGTYWWRVQLEDTSGRISPWSEPVAFRVDDQGVNEPPLLRFDTPASAIGTSEAIFTIQWTDWDTDDDARIALYYDTNRQGADGTLIVEDLSEGGEGFDDTYDWNLSGLPRGTFYIYAVITDDDSTFTTYARGSVTVLPSTQQVTMYEDAEDENIAGWEVYDADPAGAQIANVYDDDRLSRVIEFSGSGMANGYRLRNEDGSRWQNGSQFVIEWSMNTAESFTVYIDVETTDGHRYLTYHPVDYNDLGEDRYIRHGLGVTARDGQWHTYIRDLQADLSEAQPGVTILEVNGFLIRGSGRVDDIKLMAAFPAGLDSDGDGISDYDEMTVYRTLPYLVDTDGDGITDTNELSYWGSNWSTDYDGDGLNNLIDRDADNDGIPDGVEIELGADPSDPGSMPTEVVYEDAEDENIAGWEVYDADPAGAQITNVYDDDRLSRVIELSGSGMANGYRLRNEDGSRWQNGSQFVIQWSMNTAESFTVYIDAETTDGHRYLTYHPADYNDLGEGRYIRHGLGSNANDGQWRTYVRDLQADLSEAQPGVTILEVNGFLIRGSGRVDNIKLMAAFPAGLDSDGDGISDYNEMTVYRTLPYLVDTDGDGITDTNELIYWDSNWSTDYDGDGLSNLVDPDADNDGIADGAEIDAGTDPSDPVSVPAEVIYEDAEDELVAGWEVYDADPAGAQIANVYDDDRLSRVIELSGSGRSNGYRLRNEDGIKWQNGCQFVIEWSMNTAENFTVYIDVETDNGHRYLTYHPVDYDDLGEDRYIRHGLGVTARDGQWHTYVRDLQADLSEAQPGVTVLEVNGFLIRGSGRVDDISLRLEM